MRTQKHRIAFGLWALAGLIGVAQGQTGPTLPPIVSGAGGGPEIHLTLQESVVLALKNNLGIQVSRYAPLITETSIRRAFGEFDSLLYADTTYRDSTIPTGSVLQGAETLQTKTWNIVSGYRQKIFTGLSYDISLDTARTESNSRFIAFNPQWESNLNFNLSQPLLRGWGGRINRTAIEVARGNLRQSQAEFEQSVMATVAGVETAYWDLAFAISDLDVKRESLQLAEEQLERNRIQVEVGTMAPIEITQARAEVASREEGIIRAQTAIENTQDTVKSSLNLNAGTHVDATVVPLDQPSFVPQERSLEEEVRVALESRPELKLERERLANAERNRDFYRNQMKPQLDLVASFGSSGLNGQRLIFDCDPFDPTCQPSETIPGGAGGAFGDVFGFDFRTWSVGANFSLPIQNDTNGALYRQYELEVEQSQARLRDLENQIALEVRNAYRNVEAAIKLIDATRLARELQNEKLEAEQKKFSVGTSTNFQVLTFQNDLTQARTNELSALIGYNKLLVNLELAKGTLLSSRGISIGS